jgi:hypothetical protein
MRKMFAALITASLLLGSSGVLAQDGDVGEIIVTAERREEFDAGSTPVVVLRRRADNLIVQVTVICDTRDISQRREELKTTLRNLIRAAAKNPGVELGLGSEIVGAFDETMLDTVIGPAAKADTSVARLLIKTRVTPTDTLDAATGRIEKFIAASPKAGRTEILVQGDWNLTLIRPEQYRAEIIALIAKDSLKSAAAFGPDYGVSVQGLNLPVTWYQAGPLDLALYVPYRLEVRAK